MRLFGGGKLIAQSTLLGETGVVLSVGALQGGARFLQCGPGVFDLLVGLFERGCLVIQLGLQPFPLGGQSGQVGFRLPCHRWWLRGGRVAVLWSVAAQRDIALRRSVGGRCAVTLAGRVPVARCVEVTRG